MAAAATWRHLIPGWCHHQWVSWWRQGGGRSKLVLWSADNRFVAELSVVAKSSNPFTRLIVPSGRYFGQWHMSLSIGDIRHRPLWWCASSLPIPFDLIFSRDHVFFECSTPVLLSFSSLLTFNRWHVGGVLFTTKDNTKNLLHYELLHKIQNTVYFVWNG